MENPKTQTPKFVTGYVRAQWLTGSLFLCHICIPTTKNNNLLSMDSTSMHREGRTVSTCSSLACYSVFLDGED